MMRRPGWGIVLAMAMAARAADAGPIRIISAGALEEPLRAVAADFIREKDKGATFDFMFETAGGVQAKIRAGVIPDVVVIPTAAITALQHDGILPQSRVDLARAVIGAGVHGGTPMPDISTVEAFRTALLKARSVASTDPAAGGTAGTYFAGLLKRLGIADEVNRKSVLRSQGKYVAEAVGKGEAELGITFLSELLPIKGVTVVGPLPEAIQNPTIYAAVVPTSGRAGDAAKAFLAFAASPAMRRHYGEYGLEPLGK